MQHVKQAILAKLQEYRNIAIQKGWEPPVYGVRFDLKGTCAGKACYKNGQHYMRFNLNIAAENLESFLKRTVPHELAHVLQHKYAINSKPHGVEWDRFCIVLTGKTMPRCHTYKVDHLRRKRNVKRYLYSCNCRSHQVSTTVHNRILGGKRYFCKSCGTTISVKSVSY